MKGIIVLMSEEKVKIIPLGGLGEIGKNITVIECDDEIVVIDCGIAFPDEEMYGVDLIIPDITYLKNNVEKIIIINMDNLNDSVEWGRVIKQQK